jgi:hypothetical protein
MGLVEALVGSIRTSTLCAAVLVLAPAVNLAGLSARPVFAQERPPQPRENASNPSQAATFAGTVVQNGQQYDLRDSSGEVFELDDAARAKPFTGKTVKVTGELDTQSKVIHVESIVNAEG